MNLKITILCLIVCGVMLSGCENGTDLTNPTSQVGYKMDKLYFGYELPCYVNVMFQVTDHKNNGISDLENDDFIVYEDGEAYSPTESFPIIKRRENTPYSLKTVLLLDNSASVGSNLEEIKSAAISMISNVTNKQEFAIYEFSETPVLLQDFTDNIDDLTDAINSINLGFATTDLYGAIIEGVKGWTDYYAIDSIQQGFLIAFTDGSDTQHSHTLKQALDAIGSKRVYTVGLGAEIDPAVLKELGKAGFYPIDNVSQVVEKFTEIQNAIVSWGNSFYWLNYMSPTRGNKEHQFKLAILNNPNTNRDGYILDSFTSAGFFSVLSGLYINATGELPYGIDNIAIKAGGSATLEATTYLPESLPRYMWQSTDESVVTLEVNDFDSSIAYATAVGTASETASIIINDTANNLLDTITVLIEAK